MPKILMIILACDIFFNCNKVHRLSMHNKKQSTIKSNSLIVVHIFHRLMLDFNLSIEFIYNVDFKLFDDFTSF